MKPISLNVYPGGRHTCLTMSYDDGHDEDIRLAQIFRENGIVGTFHLNLSTLGTARHVRRADIADIYRGHEVSCHMAHHPYAPEVPDGVILRELLTEREVLEESCDYVVRGLSYPYGGFNARVIAACRAAGMEYGRTAKSSGGFGWPKDFMEWAPTCHHKENLMDKLERLYNSAKKPEHPRLFYVWGHSYEFRTEEDWAMITEFCRRIGGREDTWYASNIQIVDYINALRQLRVSADGRRVYNPTATEVWFTVGGEVYSVAGGKSLTIDM